MKARFEKMRSEQSGFTLVELLIVIVILGILAAVVTFGVSTFRSNATTAACQANLSALQSGAAAYQAATGNSATAASDLVPAYISAVPTNPSSVTWSAGVPSATC